MAPMRSLTALLLVLATAGGVRGDTLAIPTAAYALVPSDSGLDPSKLIELPPGCHQFQPCANEYFVRWLQCSTLSAWCTTFEVYARCTYEPESGWFRGFVGYPGLGQINAPKSWPYCLDLLSAIYAKAQNFNIQSDTVDIWNSAFAHPRIPASLPPRADTIPAGEQSRARSSARTSRSPWAMARPTPSCPRGTTTRSTRWPRSRATSPAAAE